MDLSVIIVNYNVKYFLEQCLHAVIKASGKLDTEIIVVDNNSADGSVQMISEKFTQVKIITNKINSGFARANNQAIRLAKGKYILLLNPDTVVQEDTFSSCVAYMNSHEDVACLGVKMIDGKGNYLPESKRALPTPWVAFYKIFGLSALFPHSKLFGKYHLGYLNKNEIHEVDIISGAFMFMRKTSLEIAGLLDEDFFMYGEDIDLSYRFKQAGFKNMYFPLTTIIHYKGESTKKSSINYVLVFYRAMMIFARKHFSETTFRYYSFFIHLAIYFRGGVSVLSRFFAGVITPLLDALVGYSGYLLLLPVWEKYHFGSMNYYPPKYLHIVVPGYILIWIFSVFISTGYEKKSKLKDVIRGVLMGSFIILIVYALIPETWRFSRVMIFIGTFWMLFSTISIRYLLNRINKEAFSFELAKKKKRIIIIGDRQESKRVYSIVNQTEILPELVGFVSAGSNDFDPDFIGHMDQIEEIVRINKVDELIFCASVISSETIIKNMLKFTDTGIDFKIAPPESLSVIGSNSNYTTGELYIVHFSPLSRLQNKRKKRVFDLFCAILLLAGYPVFMFIIKHPAGLIRNTIKVMIGTASWVGYYQSTGGNHPGLPGIKPGVLSPDDMAHHHNSNAEYVEKINLSYAKDYKLINDWKIFVNNLKKLGREHDLTHRVSTADGK